MTHEASQPTLESSPASPHGPRAQTFALIDLIAALALRRATREPAPLSPSSALTIELVRRLTANGAISTQDDNHRLPYDEVERTLYDPIVFKWNAGADPAGLTDVALAARIQERIKNPGIVDEVVATWRLLAEGELEGYLQYLLRKHGLPTYWAISARALAKTWLPELSLAKLRYVVWAAIRAAASTYMCTNGDLDQTRRHLENALRKRPAWLASEPSVGLAFLPSPEQKVPLTVSTFLRDVANLGTAYWSAPPSVEALARHSAR